jgi:hypothetical protein
LSDAAAILTDETFAEFSMFCAKLAMDLIRVRNDELSCIVAQFRDGNEVDGDADVSEMIVMQRAKSERAFGE